jgi:hypothetical protein
MKDRTVNRFRKRRGKRLAERLKHLAAGVGRPLSVLDVGGRRDYWDKPRPNLCLMALGCAACITFLSPRQIGQES